MANNPKQIVTIFGLYGFASIVGKTFNSFHIESCYLDELEYNPLIVEKQWINLISQQANQNDSASIQKAIEDKTKFLLLQIGQIRRCYVTVSAVRVCSHDCDMRDVATHMLQAFRGARMRVSQWFQEAEFP